MNTHGVVNNCFPSKYVSRAFKYFLLSLMVQACCEETVKVTMEMRGEPSTACRKESVESSSYGQSKGEQKGLWFFLLPWITSSCLIILLRSLISYISPSGFLCFSDSICQAMRYEVKWQPELKESPEEVENQVKKKSTWGTGELGKAEQGRNSVASLVTAALTLQGGQESASWWREVKTTQARIQLGSFQAKYRED